VQYAETEGNQKTRQRNIDNPHYREGDTRDMEGLGALNGSILRRSHGGGYFQDNEVITDTVHALHRCVGVVRLTRARVALGA